jgi:DNA-binding MarR family transcriptional regulator
MRKPMSRSVRANISSSYWLSRALAYNRTAVAKKPFTAKQGQYLAFIFYYTKIHGFAPAESDMQKYFKVSPPSVHQMVLTLEANGFVERVPGRGRSIRLLISREELPDLE